MTGRYVRKSVPLEVRGVSRGDHIEESFVRRTEPLASSLHQDTLSSYYVEGGLYSDLSSTCSDSLVGASYGHQATTTGNTTDRSSIYSFGEDEFDPQASRQVRALFESIDSMLFEQRSGPGYLQGECQDWVCVFPHLRILGEQMISPQDPGFQMVHASDTLSSSLLTDVTDTDVSVLAVSGRQLDVQGSPGRLQEPARPEQCEEVFAQDGCVEDIIALDNASEEDKVSVRRPRKGMPPLTPHACLTDNIAAGAFDVIWHECLSWLRLLLGQYRQLVCESDDDVPGGSEDHDGFPLHHHPHPFHLATHDNSLLSSVRLQDRAQLGGPGLQPGGRAPLEGVLTISSKALLTRERSNLQTEEQFELAHSVVGPGSSLMRLGGPPGSVKMAEQRMMSARQKGASRARLAPLERVKTPSVNEDKSHHRLTNEVLIGHRLAPVNDITPPLPFSRNGALPPIGLLESAESPRASSSKTAQKRGGGGLRVSSAVHPPQTDARLPLREKILLSNVANVGGGGGSQDGRPNTTQAIHRLLTAALPSRKSETPLGLARRSSTPMGGFANLRLTHGNTTLGLPGSIVKESGLVLNVTGSSINPQTEGSSPSHGEEEVGDLLTHPAHRWGASNLNPQLRRAKMQHQAVR